MLAARSLPSPRTHWRKHRRLRRRASGRSLPYNLRFPGQIYLAETGLNQNWNRDYDPLTGRYIESDPIGLQGGINTYGYVGSSPLRYVDPYGLFDPSTWVGPTVEGIETVSAAAVTAVVGGVVALAFPTPAGDPNRSDESNLNPTRGGPGCPPGDQCRQLRDAIARLHQTLSATPLDLTPAGLPVVGPANAKILRLRQELNDLIDLYNRLCASETGPLDNSLKLPVGPQGPSIPGTPLIHDTYSK